jgi:mannose-6-phosphate isomerase-like protein (cupin superfamily)
MPIEIIDTVKLAHELKKRKMVLSTPRMHAWVHYYPNPGDKDDMHCHNADQTFYVIEGECTMHFPDGGKAVMKPGMAALITGGSFYQLENSGPGPMVMMGNRSGHTRRCSTSITSCARTSSSSRPKRRKGSVTAALSDKNSSAPTATRSGAPSSKG